jgi:hypothetical protein
MRPGHHDVAAFGEMEIARATIVEQAIGDVGGLLDLQHRQPGPKRMNCARGVIDELPATRRPPVDVALDRAVEGGVEQLLGGHYCPCADA